VIKDLNFTNVEYNDNKKSCYMPTSINFEVLYSEAGYSNNKQIIINSARLYLKYEDVFYMENSVTNLFNLELKSIGKFIKLQKSVLEQMPFQPNILPYLPGDIADILISDD
jgi:hypothetical protein